VSASSRVIRTRFCATMRSPAASIMALIAPVRLRLVASGLMIEKVRSTAILLFLLRGNPSKFSGLYPRPSRAARISRAVALPAAGRQCPAFAAIQGHDRVPLHDLHRARQAVERWIDAAAALEQNASSLPTAGRPNRISRNAEQISALLS